MIESVSRSLRRFEKSKKMIYSLRKDRICAQKPPAVRKIKKIKYIIKTMPKVLPSPQVRNPTSKNPSLPRTAPTDTPPSPPGFQGGGDSHEMQSMVA